MVIIEWVHELSAHPVRLVFLDRPPVGFELEALTTTRLPRAAAITLTFHTDLQALTKRLPTLIDHTAQAGMIWVCWPKKAAARERNIKTDLDENLVREIGLAAGVVDVKVCAIDEVWSGLKFVRRLADRAN